MPGINPARALRFSANSFRIQPIGCALAPQRTTGWGIQMRFLRRLAVPLSFLLTVVFALPTLAQDDWDDFEDDDGGTGYWSTVGNRLGVATNSLLTWPADPFMAVLRPDQQLEKLPVRVYTMPVVTTTQGLLLSVFRLGTGAVDLVMSPITAMTMMSPEPRFLLIPGITHDEY
jgi:hypothetical protein